MPTAIHGGVHRRLNDGRGMVDSRRRVHSLVPSTTGLARVFAAIDTSEMGGRKMAEATSEECTQDAISGVGRGVGDDCSGGIMSRCLLYRLCYLWCFVTIWRLKFV